MGHHCKHDRDCGTGSMALSADLALGVSAVQPSYEAKHYHSGYNTVRTGWHQSFHRVLRWQIRPSVRSVLRAAKPSTCCGYGVSQQYTADRPEHSWHREWLNRRSNTRRVLSALRLRQHVRNTLCRSRRVSPQTQNLHRHTLTKRHYIGRQAC